MTPTLKRSEVLAIWVHPSPLSEKGPPSPFPDHLGNLAPTEVGKALEGDGKDIRGPVDSKTLGGWNFLLASAWKRNG